MVACAVCKSFVKEGQKFCSGCGAPLHSEQSLTEIENLSPGEPNPQEPPSSPHVDGVRLCPLCKAAYSSSERYCEEDGAALEKVEKFVLPLLSPEGTSAKPAVVESLSQRPKWSAAKRLGLGLLLLLCAVGAYFYVVIFPENSARVIEGNLNKALKTRGFDVTVQMRNKGIAAVSGNVENGDDRNAALAIIKSHKGVKEITEAIKVSPSLIEMERTLNKELDDVGLTGVQAHVDSDFAATLSGVVISQKEKVQALKIAKAHEEVKEVNDDIKIDKGSVEQGDKGPSANYTNTKHFKLSGLSPSSWASLKYRDSITFTVPGPGRITVEAKWESQGGLALILNNGLTGITHAQKDGASPLKLSYRITPQDYAKGSKWETVIANFTSEGPREGVMRVTFSGPNSGSAIADSFDPVRMKHQIDRALAAAEIKGIAVEVEKDQVATLKGSVKTAEEKQRAIDAARRFKSIKTVKDLIFIVGS